jgi:hypothetical protein
MNALLTRAVTRRPWDDDTISPSESVARVLSYRIKSELARPTHRRGDPAASAQAEALNSRTTRGARSRNAAPAQVPASRQQSSSQQAPPAAEPVPVTPYDARLRDLLGQERWDQFATSSRRRDVSEQLTTAAAQGHDIDALITHAVTCRDWEDDPRSPSRRVGGVLHHRIEAAIASGEFKSTTSGGGLPSDVAQAVANAAAPADGTRKDTARAGRAAQTPPSARTSRPQPDRERG